MIPIQTLMTGSTLIKKSKAMASLHGQTVANTWEVSQTMSGKATVKCTGAMEMYTKESGTMVLRLNKFLNPSTLISNSVVIRKKSCKIALTSYRRPAAYDANPRARGKKLGEVVHRVLQELLCALALASSRGIPPRLPAHLPSSWCPRKS